MPTPTVHLSDAAIRAIREGLSGTGQALRVVISPRFEYDLRADTRSDADLAVEQNGVTVLLDPESAARADGMTIDFSTGPDVSGFSIANPNQPPRISQITALDLKALLDASEPFELVDVRTPDERSIAMIAGSHLLDQAYHDHLMSLDRETPLVFQCHHGMRSQAAAEYFQQQGFRRLSNLQGGIDAWSQLVDNSVPRY